jgi:hypothetical protein
VRRLGLSREIEEGSIRRVTPLRMTVGFSSAPPSGVAGERRRGTSPDGPLNDVLWLYCWVVDFEVILGRLAAGATDGGLKLRLGAGS